MFPNRTAPGWVLWRHPRRTIRWCLHSPAVRLALLSALLVAGSLTPNIGTAGRVHAAGAAPPVRYSYDAAGRLTGVADTKANQAAVYHYDPAGNITSITRGSAGILPVEPARVARSSSAPVVNNVTSGGNVITSADVGSTVTVNGQNFDPTVSADTIRFDGTVARAESATTTEVTVFVPPASGAGPVSVTTPHGTGTSAADFFIPPGAYTSALVSVASTLSNGKPAIVNLPTAGKVALLAIAATADPNSNAVSPERMSISLANATLSAYQVSVYDGQSRLVYGPGGFSAGSNGFAFDLATSGAYTIVVDPGTSTGTVQVTARQFKDVFVPMSASRSISSKPTVVSTTVPGQNAFLPFKGVAGELVSATISNSTVAGQNLEIETASGDIIDQTNTGGGSAFLDRTTLPETGQYYIVSDTSIWPSTGSFGVNLYRLTDTKGRLTERVTPGTGARVTTALPGEDAHLSFTGEAGQDVSVLIRGSSSSGTYVTATLIAPAYSVLESTPGGFNGNGFLDRVTLPQTGAYTIVLAHAGTETFSVSATLYRITDIKKAVKTSGSPTRKPVTVNTTLPGQNAYLTFHAVQGHFITVAFANSTLYGFDAVVMAPNGDQLTNDGFGFGTGSGFIDRVDVQQTGTYTLYLQHRSSNTGSVQVTVFEGVDVHKKITLSTTLAGHPLPVALSIPGQNAVLTFKGSSGEYISGTASSSAITAYQWELVRPSGKVLPGTMFIGSLFQRTQLPDSGTYHLVLLHPRENTGSGTLTLYRVRDLHGTIKPNGPSVPVNLALPGENAYLTFKGIANQSVTLNVAGTTLPSCFAAVYAPDGAQLAEQGLGTSGSLPKVALPQNGQYTVAILHNGLLTGATQVSLLATQTGTSAAKGPARKRAGRVMGAAHSVHGGRDQAAQPAARLSQSDALLGSRSAVTSRPGEDVDVTFNGRASQDVSVLLSNSSPGTSYTASLIAPDFSVLESTGCGNGTCFLDRVTLPQTGTYRVLLVPSGAATTINVSATVYRIKDIKKSVKTSRSLPGNPITIKTTAPGQDAYVTFHGIAGQFISVAFGNATVGGFFAVVTAPNGDQLASNGFGGPGFFDRTDLLQTGTYTLILQHTGPGTVSVPVTVFEGSNVQKEIVPSTTPAGKPVTVALGIPGQNAVMTFKGSAGEYVSAMETNSSLGGSQMELVQPNGKVLPGASLSGSFFERTQLPYTGSYRLVLLHSQETTGSATITLYRLADVHTSIKPNGPAVPVNLALPGDNSFLTFKGVVNHAVTVNLGLTTLPGCDAALYAPDGTQLTGVSCTDTSGLQNIALTQKGVYTLAILHQGLRTGLTQVSLDETQFGSVSQEPPARPVVSESARRVNRPGRVVPPARHLAHHAGLGTGAVVGSARDDDGNPLSGVTVSIGNRGTRTSRWGDFTLTRVPAGDRVLLIDGKTADRPGAAYGIFPIDVHVTPRRVTVLPYTVWMPRLDTKHEVTVSSPTKRAVSLTTPRIPGLKIILPAGAVVRDIHGRIVHRIGITPIPTSRPPFPFPSGHPFPVYFTVQPGGAVVTPGRVRVIYPNDDHMPPESRIPFWSYDPGRGGWWQYGYGTVTANGRSIVPDFGVDLSSFTGAGAPTDKPPPGDGGGPCGCDCGGVPGGGGGGGSGAPPGPGGGGDGGSGGGAPPGPGGSGYPEGPGGSGYPGGGGDVPGPGGTGYPGQATCGDPVSLVTGLDVVHATDLYIPDVMPINIERTYRSNDGSVRLFGQGESFNYELYVTPTAPWVQASLVLPDGQQIQYDRISPGNQELDSEYESVDSPGLFYSSRLLRLGWGPWAGWELSLTNGTGYVFTQMGWSGNNAVLTSVVDRNDNTTTLSWDPNAREINSIRSPNGYWVTFSHTGENPISQIQDDTGRTVTYTYSGGQLTSVTDPRGETTTYGYSGSNLTSITDARGNAFETNAYDNQGRVIQQTQADGGTYSFHYLPAAQTHLAQTEVQYPNGSVRVMYLDAAGFPYSDTFANASTETETYRFNRDSNGLILSEIDPLGRKTDYTYDADGNVTSVTRLAGTPQAQTYTYTWNQFAEPTSVTDPLGHTTLNVYDAHGNLTSVTDPIGRRWIYTYNSEGEVTSAADPTRKTWRYAYASGARMSTTDPLGRTSSQVTDGAGRVISTTDAMDNTITYAYDAENNLTSSTDPVGDTTSMTYDPDNSLVGITDPNGHTTYNTYDSMDRLCATTDPLASLTAPLTACPSAATSHTTVYTYDKSGNLIKQIDRKGLTTTYAYDLLDRLTKATYADGSTVSYRYDAGNRLTGVDDSKSGAVTNTYDGLDRLTSQTDPVGRHSVTCDGHNVTICYTYDAANNRAGMVVAGQQPVTYRYNAANDLTSETQGPGSVGCGGLEVSVCLTYNPDDHQAAVLLPDGVKEAYTYDGAQQLVGTSYGRGSGSTSCGAVSVGTCLGYLSYGYDADGEVTSVAGPWARTNLPAPVASATYNVDNELTTWGGTALTYDADGNLTTNAATAYAWNARNELSTVSGAISSSYAYDGLGRRIGITSEGKTTQFVYDGLNLAQETQNGEPEVNLLDGLNRDQTFGVIRGGSSSSPLVDRLGSTVALADSTGSVSTRYTYDPFGNTSTSGAVSANAAQFAGMTNDASTGLYFDNARYYSPGQGRFVSQDPLGLAGGTPNLYQYVLDAPTDYSDPLGLEYVVRDQNGNFLYGGTNGWQPPPPPTTWWGQFWNWLTSGPTFEMQPPHGLCGVKG